MSSTKTAIQHTRHSLRMKPALSSPYNLSYTNYGNMSPSHQIFCAHRMTGNAMDFDPLATFLYNNYKPATGELNISCIDLCGRGHSDDAENPTLYKIAHHLTECDDVINQLRLHYADNLNTHSRKFSWIGTSFGALLGMYYAAFYFPTIDRLVINDIGPFISSECIQDSKQFVMNNPAAQSMEEMALKLKEKHSAEYGPNITEQDWLRMAQNGSYYDEAHSAYRLRYDPNLIEGFLMDMEVAMNADGSAYADWDVFDTVWRKIPPQVRILVIRGQNSTMLTRETVDRMIEINPRVQVCEIEHVGHHPLLCDREQMEVIAQFLALRKQ